MLDLIYFTRYPLLCVNCSKYHYFTISGVPRNFVWGRGSINSVEDRGQRERGSGGGSLIVRFWRLL